MIESDENFGGWHPEESEKNSVLDNTVCVPLVWWSFIIPSLGLYWVALM